MAQKFRPKKEKTKEQTKKRMYVLMTIGFLLIVGLVTAIICFNYYQVKWETIAYWLNPFSEGNYYAWLVYCGIAIAIVLVLFSLKEKKTEIE